MEFSENQTDWFVAKKEWRLLTIFDTESNCACTHPIMENCVIQNRHNNNELTVGNVCINHFGEEELAVPPSCRSSLKHLQDGPDDSKANEALLELSMRLHIISKKEHDEYLVLTTGKGSRNRFNSEHEDFDGMAFEVRKKINGLICLGFRADRPKCVCRVPVFMKPRQNGKNGSYFYSCASFPRGCKSSHNAQL